MTTEIEYLDDEVSEEGVQKDNFKNVKIKEEVFPTYSGGFVDLTGDEEDYTSREEVIITEPTEPIGYKYESEEDNGGREYESDNSEQQVDDDEETDEEEEHDSESEEEEEEEDEYVDLSECGSSVECNDSESDDFSDSDSEEEEEFDIPSVQNIDENINLKKNFRPDFFDDEHEHAAPVDESFEYGEVIDGDSRRVDSNISHFDEDIGGQSIASASVVAAGLVGCAAAKKSNKKMFLFGAVFLGIVGIASYLIWMKVNEMRKELKKLELQQNMVLDEKDIEVVVADTIEGYLKRETEKTLQKRKEEEEIEEKKRKEEEEREEKEQELLYNNLKKSTLETISEEEKQQESIPEEEDNKECEIEQIEQTEQTELEYYSAKELTDELKSEPLEPLEPSEPSEPLESSEPSELEPEQSEQSEPFKKKRGRPRKSVVK